MSDRKLEYRGYARVYLQGADALEPTPECDERQMTYFVGSEQSSILVSDYRPVSVTAAKRALEGVDTAAFAESFNQPAWIEIRTQGETAEIKLRDCRAQDGLPVLWMGTVEGEELPEHQAAWEVVRRLERERLAFAVMTG